MEATLGVDDLTIGWCTPPLIAEHPIEGHIESTILGDGISPVPLVK